MADQQRKGPIVVGPIDTRQDPVVKQAAAGVAARMEQARKERPKIGDLAAANEGYKPGRDGPMTIGQIAESQRRATAGPDGPQQGGLSPASVQGLQAIAAATNQARTQKKETTMNDQPNQSEAKPQQAPPPPQPKVEEREDREDLKEKVARKVNDLDDLELEQIMRSIQTDVINNTKERDHVKDPANKRVSEIDFGAGVSSGEFTQWVEIVPGKLRVNYRTVTAMEMQAIRLWLFGMVTKNPMLDRLAAEVYGMATLVASVVQINSDRKPSHLKQEGQGTYTADFDEVAFESKYKIFARMPQPLLHAIGTHGQWFDIRVREMFTSDYAKNG